MKVWKEAEHQFLVKLLNDLSFLLPLIATLRGNVTEWKDGHELEGGLKEELVRPGTRAQKEDRHKTASRKRKRDFTSCGKVLTLIGANEEFINRAKEGDTYTYFSLISYLLFSRKKSGKFTFFC